MRLDAQDKEGHASFGFKKEETRVPLLKKSHDDVRMSIQRLQKIKATVNRLNDQLEGVQKLLEQELKVLGEFL